MFGTIGKFIGAAKSVSDIISGKGDAEDYAKTIDVAGDILTQFVPAAAPVVEIAEKFAPALINVMNKQEPGSGDKFKEDLDNLNAVMQQLCDRAEADAKSVTEMDDREFLKYVDQTGF